VTDKKGIDHFSADRIWSESVYADCVSADGQSGFIVRLCRYPEQNTSWLWVHIFLPGKIYAFNDNYLSCPEGRTRVEEEDIIYSLPDNPAVFFKREGPRDNPLAARVSSRVMAHWEAHAPGGNGPVPIRVEAGFRPRHNSWRPNKFRSEWLGSVEGKIWIDRSEIEIQGLGHWHEQHQKAPRWQVPFTYLSLRGRNLALIATAIRNDDRGFVFRGSHITKVTSISVDPPAEVRLIKLQLEDGSQIRGEISRTHEYSVPIYETRRPGTLVRAEVEGERLSGCINDYLIQA
jgi:hypothetical protein